MVILGGMGNTPGVILAAILLTVLPEVLRAVDQYRMVLYALLLIVLMLVRPTGLFNFDYRSGLQSAWAGGSGPRGTDGRRRP
jgi:branched-chain amino acid transport system permease protein